MKKIVLVTALVLSATTLMISCAKKVTGTSANESTKRYLDAWIALQKQSHSEYLWNKTPLGSYILESSGGDGSSIGSGDKIPYARVHITMFDLNGEVLTSTTEFWAKRLGYYDQGASYAPVTVRRGSGTMAPGTDEIISLMSVGQKIKVLVPGWLMADDNNYPRYDTADEYFEKCTGTTAILEVELFEGIEDIEQYQIHQITSFLYRKYEARISEGDSSGMHGFYYFQLKAPEDTAKISNNISGKVNYTGMLTNSKVFDTTSEDLAKESYIYNEGASYSPVQVTWAENYEDITMGSSGEGSSLITGFKFALSKMKEGEKGVAVFTSDLGYGAASTGNIPPYSPLAFELEVVSVDR